MPSPAVYTHIYNLGSSVPTATTVLPAGQANPATLTDNLDGASNGARRSAAR